LYLKFNFSYIKNESAFLVDSLWSLTAVKKSFTFNELYLPQLSNNDGNGLYERVAVIKNKKYLFLDHVRKYYIYSINIIKINRISSMKKHPLCFNL
jgi:hypothetical protein